MTGDRAALSGLLAEYLERYKGTLKQMAEACGGGVSASYLSLLKRRRKKNPSNRIVACLAGALSDLGLISSVEKRELLDLAGIQDASLQPIKALEDSFRNSRLSQSEQLALLADVRQFIARWRFNRSTSRQPILTAVVAAAGWQSLFLSPEHLETTLVKAANEVAKAGIKDLVLVLTPETANHRLLRLRKKFPDPKIVVQEQPRGLGSALLLGRPHISGPFAVVLPDDVDPTGTTLGRMVKIYQQDGVPLLAVSPAVGMETNQEKQFCGVAILGEEVCDRIYTVLDAEEKRPRQRELLSTERLIAARYILTPQLLDILDKTKINTLTTKYELTDAFSQFLGQGHKILAYELKEPLIQIAPVRSVITRFIRHIDQKRRSQRFSRLLEEVLLIDAIPDPRKRADRINVVLRGPEDQSRMGTNQRLEALLESFDRLPIEAQEEAVAEILKRSRGPDSR